MGNSFVRWIHLNWFVGSVLSSVYWENGIYDIWLIMNDHHLTLNTRWIWNTRCRQEDHHLKWVPKVLGLKMLIWLVLLDIFYFHPYLTWGRFPGSHFVLIMTNQRMFQMGLTTQLVMAKSESSSFGHQPVPPPTSSTMDRFRTVCKRGESHQRRIGLCNPGLD